MAVRKKAIPLHRNQETMVVSECSAVGSALRSGRRGRAFESPHSDKVHKFLTKFAQMAESVDALVSNTSGVTSIPVRPRVWVLRRS